MELNAFIQDCVERTRDYVSRCRGGVPVDFQLNRDDLGTFKAGFTYGRAAYGSSTQAIFRAIANAIEPLEAQDDRTLKK